MRHPVALAAQPVQLAVLTDVSSPSAGTGAHRPSAASRRCRLAQRRRAGRPATLPSARCLVVAQVQGIPRARCGSEQGVVAQLHRSPDSTSACVRPLEPVCNSTRVSVRPRWFRGGGPPRPLSTAPPELPLRISSRLRPPGALRSISQPPASGCAAEFLRQTCASARRLRSSANTVRPLLQLLPAASRWGRSEGMSRRAAAAASGCCATSPQDRCTRSRCAARPGRSSRVGLAQASV